MVPSTYIKAGCVLAHTCNPSTEWWLAITIARAHWPASLVKAASSHFIKRDPASKMRQKSGRKTEGRVQYPTLAARGAYNRHMNFKH